MKNPYLKFIKPTKAEKQKIATYAADDMPSINIHTEVDQMRFISVLGLIQLYEYVMFVNRIVKPKNPIIFSTCHRAIFYIQTGITPKTDFIIEFIKESVLATKNIYSMTDKLYERYDNTDIAAAIVSNNEAVQMFLKTDIIKLHNLSELKQDPFNSGFTELNEMLYSGDITARQFYKKCKKLIKRRNLQL